METQKIKTLTTSICVLLGLMLNPVLGYAEVSFLAMGDSPYTDEGYYLIEKELQNIPKNTKFLVHLGDIKPKEKKCEEKVYRDFRNLLKQALVPVFIIPGDNGYDVCEDKLKAKQFWDEYISEFEKHWKIDFEFKRQEEQRENFSFFLENTLFIGIRLFEKRDKDTINFNKMLRNNIYWIKNNLEQHTGFVKSVIVFAHDFSGLRSKELIYEICGDVQLNSWEADQHYKYFSDQFIAIAQTINKPILYMQGNHHCWTHDFPYKESPNIERIVVDKIETAPLVQITVKDGNFLIDQRKNKKIDFFIINANLGDIWSQYFLGKEYLKLEDHKNAKKWFNKASIAGFDPATVQLGIIAKKEKKYGDALKLIESAIKSNKFHNINLDFNNFKTKQPESYGHRITNYKNYEIKSSFNAGNFHIGIMYENGFGAPRNYKKALEYYKKASLGGLGIAGYNIALMYYRGSKVDKDYKKAMIWFKKAASKGVVRAFNKLGVIYIKGQGVERDYKEAAKWFKLARHHKESIYNLGVLYFNGLGVEKDQKVAISYFKNAAILGSKEARNILKKLELLRK
jgi:TPR repeat protein